MYWSRLTTGTRSHGRGHWFNSGTAHQFNVGFRWRERIGRIGFCVLFAVVVTTPVQFVGVYLVFTTLIVPAVATYRYAAKRQLAVGYALAIVSYIAGVAPSVVTDLPSSAVIVRAMAIFGWFVYLAGATQNQNRNDRVAGVRPSGRSRGDQ